MLSIPLKATHYMTFRTGTAGLTRGSFTYKLFVDGADRQDIAIDIREVFSKIYVASFTNDADVGSFWSLVIYETGSPTATYQETWYVEDTAVKKDIPYIKAQL